MTGSRQPLEKALAASLAAAIRDLASRGRPPHVLEQLERLAEQDAPSGSAVVRLFEEANNYLERFGTDAIGILLIIDELGKFLEFGANHPERSDVFVLQELAEAATRAQRPFLILTILHQALDRYAEYMSPGRRAEWAKVQDRYEDVAFEERSDQLLWLLSRAIQHEGPEEDLKMLHRQGNAFALEERPAWLEMRPS